MNRYLNSAYCFHHYHCPLTPPVETSVLILKDVPISYLRPCSRRTLTPLIGPPRYLLGIFRFLLFNLSKINPTLLSVLFVNIVLVFFTICPEQKIPFNSSFPCQILRSVWFGYRKMSYILIPSPVHV